MHRSCLVPDCPLAVACIIIAQSLRERSKDRYEVKGGISKQAPETLSP